MAPRRTREPSRPVTFSLDGVNVAGDAEASVASALVGAGHLVLARSPKFHRPRGPACMRAGCDGCLMRIDGVPNIMACTVHPRDGMRVERQNVVLSPKLDLMRAADWFFPNGMNHHELLAGFPGTQSVMVKFARHVSGLGELPDLPESVAPGRVPTVFADVLVVGAGPAGLAMAAALRETAVRVVVVDEQRKLGGGLLSFPAGSQVRFRDGVVDVDNERDRLVDHAMGERVEFLSSATMVGIFEGDDWLIDTQSQGLVRIEARRRVIATGAHDSAPSFIGNDLPGVISARGAGRLLRDGVLIGNRPLVLGDGPYAIAFIDAARAQQAQPIAMLRGEIIGVRGLSRVRTAIVRDDHGGERRVDCDAVVIDQAPAPAFEIAWQAGSQVRHTNAGFPVATDEDAHVRPDPARGSETTRVLAIGEVVGAQLDPAAFRVHAAAVARALVLEMERER